MFVGVGRRRPILAELPVAEQLDVVRKHGVADGKSVNRRVTLISSPWKIPE
jgi:hypothetical protein